MVEGSFLPKNTEIEAALVARQRLFGQEQHETTLEEQRARWSASNRGS